MLPNTINRLIINTGNLISYKEFKKKASQTPTEEFEIQNSLKRCPVHHIKTAVFESISSAFSAYLSTVQVDQIKDVDTLKCINKTRIKVEEEDRINLKITVKIFLVNFSCDELNSAVFQVMDELGITVIDSLILSLPLLSSEEKFSLDRIKPLWSAVENLVEDSKVLTVGFSDFDTEELIQLYNWSQVKPGVNQVNLESCCVMPAEMTAFASDHDIQLLTHNDPKVLLPREMFQKVLEHGISSPETWDMKWIIRYSVVVKSRGIIQNKGYLLCAVKGT